ncbi:MAG: hypothetical protein KC643_25145 [Nitrospira sp.]|nr:hypothetical protein [Nitrospira sp.]
MVELGNLSEGYSADETVFLWSKKENIRNVVHEICKRHNFKVFDATESESSEVDWLAVPFFVCVVDRGWYNSHQDKISEFSKMGLNNFVNIIQIGEDLIKKNDSEHFVQLTDSDFFKVMEYSIVHEKKQFDENMVKNNIV